MSPTVNIGFCAPFSVPRASGDEPETQRKAIYAFVCSPRERG